GPDPKVCTGRARLLVYSLDVLPLQLSRPAEVADGIVCSSQVVGCVHLHGTLTEFGRKREGLLARRHGAVEVSRHPEYTGPLGYDLSQPGPVVEHPGQGLGLAQEGEEPPRLSQGAQRGCQSEAELDGQPPSVTVLGQVHEGLEGLLKGGHRLAECGAVVVPGTGLSAVGDGFGPHLAPDGMTRAAFHLPLPTPSPPVP